MKRFLVLSLGLLSFILLGVFFTDSSVKAWGNTESPTICELDTQIRLNIQTNLSQWIRDEGYTEGKISIFQQYNSNPDYIGFVFTSINGSMTHVNTGSSRGVQYTGTTGDLSIYGYSSNNGETWSVIEKTSSTRTVIPQGCVYYETNVPRGYAWFPLGVPEFDFNYEVEVNYDDIVHIEEAPFVIKQNGNSSSPTHTFDSSFHIGSFIAEYDINDSSGQCSVNTVNFNDFKTYLLDDNPYISTLVTTGTTTSSKIIHISVLKHDDESNIHSVWSTTGGNRTFHIQNATTEPVILRYSIQVIGGQPRICGGEYANTTGTLASSASNPYYEIIETTFNVTYPDGYQGDLIPASLENLKPEFSYTVDKTGKLSWQYMGNIKPFLTGVFFTNIDSLNSNWTLDNTIQQVSSNPAGWLDESWTLPEAGYYQLLISHSQQLDNPPWTNQNFFIQPIVMQFYWDGSTAIRGDNTQCSATETCNPLLINDPSKMGLFPNLNLPTYGLIEAIKSPLLFLSTLPAKMASNACVPLSLPLPYMDENLVLPCMRPIYEEHFSGIYNLWSTLLVSMFSYHMAISLFARIKSDVSPKDDTIQVAQL